MRRLLGALAVLVAAWLLAPGGVPLYDGVGFPDEPYRYVVPPRADLPRTDPPTEGRDMVRAADAAGGSEVLAQSREMGPQVAVSMQRARWQRRRERSSSPCWPSRRRPPTSLPTAR
ncbi:MAG: hypothetical protein M3Z02_06575 [Actinomycetota bacterium]|nr:hypothetical protein [Actinomycetota bacterium]